MKAFHFLSRQFCFICMLTIWSHLVFSFNDCVPSTSEKTKASSTDLLVNSDPLKNRQQYITLGSTKNEVASIQGTPKCISNFGGVERWEFSDDSTISFHNGKVSGWRNQGLLRVRLESEKAQTASPAPNCKDGKHNEASVIFPHVAENNSYKGEISSRTGRPRNKHVRGYYKKNGTYVRGHYRS